jgi:ABC-2 type transport system permease protein
MKDSLKAEFRKLFTVRSTFFILAFTLLLVIFFAFYVTGYKINKIDLLSHATLANDMLDAVSAISVFGALIAALLITHEYRYNTIMHTLTLSNSRTRVLVSKTIVITIFGLIYTAFFVTIAPLLTLLGIHLHHLHLVHQSINYWPVIWKSLFFGWGYIMAGLVLGALIKNQVGTIVVLLIGPATIESLIGLLLKRNVVYLPFSALHQVVGRGEQYNNVITPIHAVYVFMAYLVGAWLIAWFLFLKRDAN